jgi:hypothetical protein
VKEIPIVRKLCSPFQRLWLGSLATFFAVLLTTSSASQAVAQNAPAQEMKNLVVVSVSEYDELLGDLGFLGEMAGKPDLAQMLEQTLNLFTQQQGLAGLDKTKPWGAVLRTDGLQFQAIGFVPVTDLKKLIDVLATLNVAAEPQDDGSFQIEVNTPAGAQSTYVKQQGGWAFISQNSAAFEDVPADPIPLLDGLNEEYDIAVRLYVQNTPELYRQMAIQHLKDGAARGLEQFPTDEPDQEELGKTLTQLQLKGITQLVEETDHVTLGWSIDAKEKTTHMDFRFVALEGTALAKQADGLRNVTSSFGGFLSPGAALQCNFSRKYSPEEIEQMIVMLDALRGRAEKAIDDEQDLPGDAARQALKSAVSEIAHALQATAKSGKSDGGVMMNLDPENIGIAAGFYLVDAARIETALKQLEEIAQKEGDFQGVQWNAESHGDVHFHTASLPIPETAAEARKFLGETLDVAVGIGQSSVYVALGANGISTLKTVIDESKSHGNRPVAPMELTVSLGKFLNFAASHQDEPRLAEIAASLQESIGDDHLKITAQPIENGFVYRLQVEQGVIQAIGKAAIGAGSVAAANEF